MRLHKQVVMLHQETSLFLFFLITRSLPRSLLKAINKECYSCHLHSVNAAYIPRMLMLQMYTHSAAARAGSPSLRVRPRALAAALQQPSSERRVDARQHELLTQRFRQQRLTSSTGSVHRRASWA